MKANSAKINNGCLNIFKFLVLLYEDNADYDRVIDIFKSDITEQKENYDDKKLNNLTQVVLNKYINALKVFGIKIRKENNKFKLDSNLYTENYSQDDLKALSIILNAERNIQDTDLTKNIAELKENLLLRMNNEDKNILNSNTKDKNLSFFYTGLKQQIDKCKQYAKWEALLDITYIYHNEEHRCTCKAIDVLYDTKTAYFKVYDTNRNENKEIALQNILSITKQPSITKKCIGTKTVLIKFKGRLAKTYKLKQNEKLFSADKDEIIVTNKDEPLDKLFSRLMRYSDLCEIVSPKYLRKEMSKLLDETLNLYN